MKILLIFLIFPVLCFSATLPNTGMCTKPINNLLNKWNSTGHWSKRSQNIYVSPTHTYGEWIAFHRKPLKTILSKIISGNEIRVEFDRSCQQKMKIITHKQTKEQVDGDKFLSRQIRKGKGVIYLWSPHMPLSVQGLKDIEKVSKKMGLKLIVLQDIKSKDIKGVAKKYRKKIHSFELKMRNAYLHFPTLLVFENGKIKNGLKYGYEKGEAYQKDIEKLFKL